MIWSYTTVFVVASSGQKLKIATSKHHSSNMVLHKPTADVTEHCHLGSRKSLQQKSLYNSYNANKFSFVKLLVFW